MYTGKITLKQLVKKDLINNLKSIINISNICWSEIDDEPWSEAMLKDDYPGKWIYSNYISDIMVYGFLIATVPDECYGEPREDKSKIGYINKLAVLPEFRASKLLINSKSIAELLVEDYFNRCRKNKLSEVRLSVLQNNSSGIKFWERIGFSKIEKRRNKKYKQMFLMSIEL